MLFNTSISKHWLNYWKQSLADSDRSVIAINTNPVAVNDDCFLRKVPKKHTDYLWKTNQFKKSKEKILVDISPCKATFEFIYGKQRKREHQNIHPFWIPALLDKQGNLYPPEAGRPFFVRDYLTPNPENYYKLSSIEKVDKVLKKINFKDNEWESYWKKAELFFKKVTHTSFSNYNDVFENTSEVYVQNHKVRNIASAILNLYDVLDKPNKYKLLKTMIAPSNTLRNASSFYEVFNAKNHYGQLDNEFPLAVSQRKSLHAFSNLKIGEVLAVTGPPGTGKTTLLKSVVANLVVKSVLEERSPFLIMASSTNNQAITNVLDSFKTTSEASFSTRWLPDLTSFGLYFSSKQSENYQTVNDVFGSGFINAYESRNYEELEVYYRNQFLNYYSKSLSLKKCKAYLLKELKATVNEVDNYLNKASKLTNSNEESYKMLVRNWDGEYPFVLKNLYEKTCEEYKNVSPLEDVNVRLDISLRHKAFWLAVHYREADFLDRLKRKSTDSKERSKGLYLERLKRAACITPIFISTFHSLPKFASYYKQGNGQLPYFELFDYLVVDEAGQVAPNIAIPSFSLAKRAVVVGDVNQIEPVWTTNEAIDTVNLLHNKLLSKVEDSTLDILKQQGKLVSSGNIMAMAQNGCAIASEGVKGTFLSEHRRCLDSIISYSNSYVYANQLQPKKGNLHNRKHNLPPKGYLNSPSQSEKIGISRVNKTEARVVAQWIHSKCKALCDDYGKPIHKIIAVLTPYKAQVPVIKSCLVGIDKSYSQITVGTVHSLQGSERDIVLFSMVLSKGDDLRFVNSSYNMINVAISRARHSFLVFGNMSVLDYNSNTPFGNLKKWLLEEESAELSNAIYFSRDNYTDSRVGRIDCLDKHVRSLSKAFKTAKNQLVIVSPFISIYALKADGINKQVIEAKQRGVEIIVVTDYKLDCDFPSGALKNRAYQGRELLKQLGVRLVVKNGIHSKTIIIDNDILIEGSFNWLSASRNVSSPYHNYEASIVIKNELAKKHIAKARKDLGIEAVVF